MTALGGSVAIVTGAGRGIGRVMAVELAAAGAALALVARSEDELEDTAAEIQRLGGAALPLRADVTCEEEVARALAEARRRLGPPDLLVNNAGTAAAIGPVWEVDPDDWWRDVETSVRGSFLVSRAVLPAMLERGSGRIVNVSSYVGVRPSPHLSAYGAAKAALINLTESLAAETSRAGIRVFAISPGHVRTELVHGLIDSDAGRRWLPHVPQSEPLEPELAARLVLLIATGAADVLSGRFLHVLDDVAGLAARADEVRRDDLLVPRLRR